MSLTRIQIPISLDFGRMPTYFENRRFSLDGLNRQFVLTPRVARPYQSYYLDRGVTALSINQGYGEYTPIAGMNRSVFLGPGIFQDSTGGTTFANASESQVRASVRYTWNRARNTSVPDSIAYGVITSGAQEERGAIINGRDPFAQRTEFSLNNYKIVSQEWGAIMSEHPGVSYVGCYDGPTIFNPSTNPQTLLTALSSDANALSFLIANGDGENPFWSQALYQHHDCLLNLYFRSGLDPHAKAFEVQMVVTLAKMAMRGAGYPNRKVCVFVFPAKQEFVDYPGQGYSEKYITDTPGGGTQFEYTFPQYSFNAQWDLAFTALDQADIYFSWEDTLLFGTDPSKILAPETRFDGFVTRNHSGGTVQVINNGPTPYDPAGNYPISSVPEGGHDIAPCAAEMYESVARYGGQASGFARHRPAGNPNWCSTGSGYLVDRYVNREPVARVARNGQQGWIRVTDNTRDFGETYQLEVDLGSNQTQTVTVEPNCPNLFKFDLSQP